MADELRALTDRLRLVTDVQTELQRIEPGGPLTVEDHDLENEILVELWATDPLRKYIWIGPADEAAEALHRIPDRAGANAAINALGAELARKFG